MSAIEEILQRHPIWRGGAMAKAVTALPTGFAALDAELPGGGWPRQGLTELLAEDAGIGELGLILPALAALTGAGKRAVWVSPPHLPYAPALAAAGVDLTALGVVAPPSRRDALWAAEQALRSGSCHALAAWLPKPRYAELQRLAVAAEASHAVAFVYRPLAAAAESSPACLRLALEPAGLELAAHLLKRRGMARRAALPASEKTVPCSGSRCTFPACRAGCSNRSHLGPASSRLGSPSRRTRCSSKSKAACAISAARTRFAPRSNAASASSGSRPRSLRPQPRARHCGAHGARVCRSKNYPSPSSARTRRFSAA